MRAGAVMGEVGGEGGALTAHHQTAGCCGGGREEEGWRLKKNVRGRRPPPLAVLNPYPFQSLSRAPRPRVALTAPSFGMTGFQEQQYRLAQTWTTLLMPCAPCSLSRKCPAGFTESFLASHQLGQDHTVFNHIFCIFSCIPDSSWLPVWVSAWDREILTEVSLESLLSF